MSAVIPLFGIEINYVKLRAKLQFFQAQWALSTNFDLGDLIEGSISNNDSV